MATPNYTISLVASPVGGTAGITPGLCLVYDSTTGTYLTATTANRGTKRASGVAIGSASVNGAVLMQTCGDIPPSISGLGAGAAGPVRVSSAGLLERATTFAAGDDVCGWAEADGTVHLFCGGPATGAAIVGDASGANVVLANPSTWGPAGATVKSKIDTLAIAGAAGTAQTVGTIDIPDGTTCDLAVTVLARRSDGSSYRADLFATYKRTSGGAPTVVGTGATEQNKRNDAGAAYASALSVSGNNVLATLTPTAGHTLNVSAVWQRTDRT